MSRRPLNKQVIVFYPDGATSWMFKRYVSIIDIRDACTRDECPYSEEHLTFDGQIFFKKK